MNSVFIPYDTPVQFSGVGLELPLVGDVVKAGFPSPALDFPGERIDLLKLLVTHPQATYFLRVKGDSMIGAGIFDNDIVVVDKAVRPRHGHIVIAQLDGGFTVKKLYERLGRVKLQAANVTFPDILFGEGETLEIFGVVIGSVKLFPK